LLLRGKAHLDAQVAIDLDINKNKKEYKEFKAEAEAAGKMILSQEDYNACFQDAGSQPEKRTMDKDICFWPPAPDSNLAGRSNRPMVQGRA
jgi:hypothetical protein